VVWAANLSKMIVWGGTDFSYPPAPFNSGAIYDPATGAWAATPVTIDTPQGRYSHTAVWSGTEMIVWSGQGADLSQTTTVLLNTGARFDPLTGAWAPMTTNNAPE